MLEGLLVYVRERSVGGLWRDALDVGIVYYAAYRALLVLRGTRAVQVGVGLSMLLALYVVARWLELVTVLSIMGTILSSLLLIIVVVFQNDIRRGLQRMGSQAVLGRFAQGPQTQVIDEVVEAATELARHRIGALIAFEQDANLDEFVGVHKGHVVDAAVTRELLVSLFVPEGVNKLHDGAVIIRSLRIAKAGVFFPMPEQRVIDESFGSRHRAAMGITEETDAVVVIVSEERGTISFCFNGNIAPNLDGPKLRTMLDAVFSPKRAQKRRTATASASGVASVRDSGPDVVETNPIITRLDISDAANARLRSATDGEAAVPTRGRATGAEGRAVAEARGAEMSRVVGSEETREDGRATVLHPSERPPPLRRGTESEPPPPPLRRGVETDPPPTPLRRGLGSVAPPAPRTTPERVELVGKLALEGAQPDAVVPAAPRVPALARSLITPRDGVSLRTPTSVFKEPAVPRSPEGGTGSEEGS